MNEGFKLAQARYFLDRMQDRAVFEDDLHFRYNLGAFLTSARSVLYYALEEAKSKGQQGWYDGRVHQSPLIEKCKHWRDEDVHQQSPVPLATAMSITCGVGFWGCDPTAPSAPSPASETPRAESAGERRECRDKAADRHSHAPPATIGRRDEQVVTAARELTEEGTRSVPPARNSAAPQPGWGAAAKRYIHPQRFGDRDVVDVCEQYLTELNDFVAEGQAQGVLTRP